MQYRTTVVMLAAGLLWMNTPAHAAGGGKCAKKPHTCDSDGDGLNNAEEATYGTDAYAADTDDDGLDDGDELAAGTDPTLADTDGDGVEDGDDVWPLDDEEWADADGDGIGDNADPDDNDNGVDDAVEVIGGAALVSDPAAVLVMQTTICAWDMVGPVDATLNPTECFAAPIELHDTFVAIGDGNPGEWEELSNASGGHTLHVAFPGLQTASQRLNGVRVIPGTNAYCYEGWVDTLGGSYDHGTGETTYYWFPTGRFAGCI